MEPETIIKITPPAPKEFWEIVIVSNYVPIGELARVTLAEPLPLPFAVAHPASFVTERQRFPEDFVRADHPVDHHGNHVNWKLYDFAVAVDQTTFDWMLREKIAGRPMPAFACLAPDMQQWSGDIANAERSLCWFTSSRDHGVHRIAMLLAANADTRGEPGTGASLPEPADQ